MYAQVEKTKENKSRAVGNPVTQTKITEAKGFGFVDNRSVGKTQRKIHSLINNHSAFQPIQKNENKTGLNGLSHKNAANSASSLQKNGGATLFGVIQMVDKEIGRIDHSGEHPGGIIDHMHIITELDEDNTYSWPTSREDHFFNQQSYGGSVTRAMNWGAGGGEGTAGWFTRRYAPDDFHNLAFAASTASQSLNNVALNNESNKTLIAIRTFRSVNMGMANKTLLDLRAVLDSVNAARDGLALANMIGNAGDNVAEVKADPAEAHPNTLPTAKITFAGGETLYFKGRSGSVENALVGINNSAAQTISALGAANAGDEVGTHTFVSEDFTHISEDVGPVAPHGPVTREEAIRAWVSAARTAALVSLTGTGDLHGSNVIDAAGATKYIIDAGFLLDATAWNRYETAAQSNEIPNFNITSMAPQWVKEHSATLSTINKLQLSDEVAQRFQAMGLDNDDTLEQILAPIRALIEHEALLRISPEPFTTAFWLTTITAFHESDDVNTMLDQIWDYLNDVYPNQYHIDLMNKDNVIIKLRNNFSNGMVPLFHVGAYTGTFYLNKDTLLGHVREDRSTERFLDLTKTALLNGYENMVLKVRAAIIDS